MQSNQKQQEVNEYAARVIRHKAKHLVGTAGFTESDRDDLEQEMMLDVITRLPKFDANKGTPKTFVARIIERKISKLIRHRTTDMRDYRREAFSLNESVEDGDGGSIERGDLMSRESVDPVVATDSRTGAEEMAFLMDLETVLAGLPDHLRRLCEILKTGTISDAAREMGIPRTTLHDHVTKLRSLFEDAGLREYL
jgi:RNA polymerase sigma-70 factor (ECF subfamily)